jgi:hypothetical protein
VPQVLELPRLAVPHPRREPQVSPGHRRALGREQVPLGVGVPARVERGPARQLPDLGHRREQRFAHRTGVAVVQQVRDGMGEAVHVPADRPAAHLVVERAVQRRDRPDPGDVGRTQPTGAGPRPSDEPRRGRDRRDAGEQRAPPLDALRCRDHGGRGLQPLQAALHGGDLVVAAHEPAVGTQQFVALRPEAPGHPLVAALGVGDRAPAVERHRRERVLRVPSPFAQGGELAAERPPRLVDHIGDHRSSLAVVVCTFMNEL